RIRRGIANQCRRPRSPRREPAAPAGHRGTASEQEAQRLPPLVRCALAAGPAAAVVGAQRICEADGRRALGGGQLVGSRRAKVADRDQERVGLRDRGSDAGVRAVVHVQLGGQQLAGQAAHRVLWAGVAAVHGVEHVHGLLVGRHRVATQLLGQVGRGGRLVVLPVARRQRGRRRSRRGRRGRPLSRGRGGGGGGGGRRRRRRGGGGGRRRGGGGRRRRRRGGGGGRGGRG